jgi:DNA replication protein DnaC
MSERCPFGICDGTGFTIDEATNTAHPCRCRPQRVGRARARALSAVIPRRFRGVSFDRAPVVDMPRAIVAEVRDYVGAVDERLDAGRGLWFTGPVGTGKTTLAMLVSKAALDAGRSVAIYSLPRLLAEIRTTFDESSRRSYTELLDRLAAVDLLHIDDVGAEKTSEWVLEQLYALINGRYEDQRAIVITTNLETPDALAEQIGERTVSRLMEICGDALHLHGPDRRRPGDEGYRLPEPLARPRLGPA